MSPKSTSPDAWLGIDLGGTKILAEVYDADFNLLGSKKRKTKAELGQKEGVQRLLRTGRDALEDAGIKTGQLKGVGIGCPGVLNLDTGVLVRAPNLGWKDVPIRKLLSDEFGCPAAEANDVDAGTFGEWANGSGKKARSVLGVFPGTGIGGALVYEGSIYRGQQWSCMEIGHMQAVENGLLCGCGRRGCLETVSGRLAISAAAAMCAIRGQAPWLRENVGTDVTNIRSGALAQAVSKGDTAVETVIRNACETLGCVLGGVVNLLAPDVVVIGGGLAEAMPELYLKTVRGAMKPKIMESLQDCCTVRIAQLGDHATSLGAAAWAMKKGTS